jgi:cyclopropane fatty-acyl-phospholipid synthase-like methyltransferase
MHYNAYNRQLTIKEIESNAHRQFVGGLWHEIGLLQYDFLLSKGLESGNSLLDLGCGTICGGIRLVRYLNSGKYRGIDSNASLLKSGQIELKKERLEKNSPALIKEDQFRQKSLGRDYDFAISISLFTHLPQYLIEKCLKGVSEAISSRRMYFASFFEVPEDYEGSSFIHSSENIKTHAAKDPFHQSKSELQRLAEEAGLDMVYIGDWKHPRAQRIASFKRRSAY